MAAAVATPQIPPQQGIPQQQAPAAVNGPPSSQTAAEVPPLQPNSIPNGVEPAHSGQSAEQDPAEMSTGNKIQQPVEVQQSAPEEQPGSEQPLQDQPLSEQPPQEQQPSEQPSQGEEPAASPEQPSEGQPTEDQPSEGQVDSNASQTAETGSFNEPNQKGQSSQEQPSGKAELANSSEESQQTEKAVNEAGTAGQATEEQVAGLEELQVDGTETQVREQAGNDQTLAINKSESSSAAPSSSPFASDPHFGALMSHFNAIAEQGLTKDHLRSIVHIGSFGLAMLAKHTGMTQGVSEAQK